jgi:hypothetical protein
MLNLIIHDGLVLAILAGAGLPVVLMLVIRECRRIPRRGRCSRCGYDLEIKRTWHGWMCEECVEEKRILAKR